MSIKVMSLVWETDLPPHQKLVLLAYADRASDDGTDVYPGEEELVRKTSYSSHHVRKVTRELIDAGVLTRLQRGRRGQRASYQIEITKLVGCHIDTQTNGDRVSENGDRVSDNASKGVLGDTPNVIEPSRTVIREEAAIAATRRRDLLWEVFCEIHGDPADNNERGKFNHYVAKLRNADVTHTEYPLLVAAYTSKHDGLQPAIATIANRIGELRHYAKRGPIQAPNPDELAERRRWEQLQAEHQEALP